MSECIMQAYGFLEIVEIVCPPRILQTFLVWFLVFPPALALSNPLCLRRGARGGGDGGGFQQLRLLPIPPGERAGGQ